jgi:hypothetical protein
MDTTSPTRGRPSMPLAVRWSIEICTLVAILSLIVVASGTWNAIQALISIIGLACAVTAWLLFTRSRYGRWLAITLLAGFLLTTLAKSFDGFVGASPTGFDGVLNDTISRVLLLVIFGVPIYGLWSGNYVEAYFAPSLRSDRNTLTELTTLENASMERNA